MKLKNLLSLLCVFSFFAAAVSAGIDARMRDNFRNPSSSAGPYVWWHWMNGNITREGIKADLQAMTDVGINGATIFNVFGPGNMNIPHGSVKCMSSQWFSMIKYAAAEADRLGLELGMHNCPGFSSSGGPWIESEDAMKVIVYSQKQVSGKKDLNIKLPQPESRAGYYKDIAVLIFPRVSDQKYRLKNYRYKAVFKESKKGLSPEPGKAAPQSIIPLDDIVDITGKMDEKGKLLWRVPSGLGAPDKVELDELISWTKHSNKGVRYFSGTATYSTEFDLPAGFIDENSRLVLDLGEVFYIGHLKLNGNDLGILWKKPFRGDITEHVKKGTNRLEIAVTNLWPNRLIGDEQYLQDQKWQGNILNRRVWGGKYLAEWPEWLINDEPRPSSNRVTFTTWKHWDENDSLITSGLLGPVTVRQVKTINLE